MNLIELLRFTGPSSPLSSSPFIASAVSPSSSGATKRRVRWARRWAPGVSVPLALGAVSPLTHAGAVAPPPVPTAPVGPPTYTVNVDKPAGDRGDVFYTTGPSAAAVGLANPTVDTTVADGAAFEPCHRAQVREDHLAARRAQGPAGRRLPHPDLPRAQGPHLVARLRRGRPWRRRRLHRQHPLQDHQEDHPAASRTAPTSTSSASPLTAARSSPATT